MGFLDRSFCSSDCVNDKCNRNISDDIRQRGTKWWGNENFPISIYDFKTGCDSYIAPKDDGLAE